MKQNLMKMALASAALATALSPLAQAANLFEASAAPSPLLVAESGEHKCGAGSCGAKGGEHKCGKDKADHKCGKDKSEHKCGKEAEHKCGKDKGEHKCGKDKSEHKCGAGSCGAKK